MVKLFYMEVLIGLLNATARLHILSGSPRTLKTNNISAYTVCQYEIDRVARILKDINAILTIICLVINLAHFLIMVQKKMRTSSINILTIGISFCDTTLVILMTITFFISQLPIGLFMWLRLIYQFHTVVQIALDHGTKVTSILFTINATCHCFIFATLSSQYREVVREVFCCRKRKNVSGS
ncbi:hypothetical protein CRE_15845 [Caenorhabditis remanei]|uniref:G-protein coupled receptors family 1 profile domain-containing protein n=1 Tax=Caenorhabditis remanei TaxID=31234 RepID=E3NTQ0_CAERE|nr:hypothetical protein CRE_15845 [Caenorhabditis remanei]